MLLGVPQEEDKPFLNAKSAWFAPHRQGTSAMQRYELAENIVLIFFFLPS